MKIKALLYCTKTKPMLRIAKEEFKGQSRARCYSKKETKYFTRYIEEEMYEANGKIVAECDFEVEKIKKVNYDFMLFTDTLDTEKLINKSCVGYFELVNYLKPNWDKEDDLQNLDTVGYAIHIKNLHIFDEPINLNQLKDRNMNIVKNAPQNMMYINCIETGNKVDLTDKILISIRPEWLCEILNGKQTIIIRKRVLKEMIEDE